MEAAEKRKRIGYISGIAGIAVNLFLFVIKMLAGSITKSVSITADAINNLSDMGSSIISIGSAKLSSKPADKEHPFGHARIEYLASLAVAVIILILAFEIIKSSVEKIISPEKSAFSMMAVIILAVSAAVKFFMFLFNSHLAKKIDSLVLKAAATDSISDVFSTVAVLISALISHFAGIELDAYMGIIVALLILWSVYGIFKDTFDRIIGCMPDEKQIKEIEKFILSYDGVIGLHDMVVHSYGPGKCFASVHVEVDAAEDILVSHDMIDNIEKDINKQMGVQLVVHLDPVVTDNEEINELKEKVHKMVKQIDPLLSIHDFRVVFGKTHTNILFDINMPFEVKLKRGEILKLVEKDIKNINKDYYAVVTIDKSYVSRTATIGK